MIDAATAILESLGSHWEGRMTDEVYVNVYCKCHLFTLYSKWDDPLTIQVRIPQLKCELHISSPTFFEDLKKAVEHPHE